MKKYLIIGLTALAIFTGIHSARAITVNPTPTTAATSITSSTIQTNLPDPLHANAVTVTSTLIVATTSPSTIPNISTYKYFPTPTALAAGAWCGTSTGVTDPQLCIAAMYTQDAGTASTTAIILPGGTYTTANTSTFSVTGHLVYIQGQPGGGTVWHYTGSSGAAFTIDNCVSNNKRQMTQMIHMVITGDTTATSSATEGIRAGGSNGACGTVLDDITISGFAYDLHTTSNTYLFTVQNYMFVNAFQAIWQGAPSNSGEQMRYLNGVTANPAANASATAYVFLDISSTASTIFSGDSFDCGGVQIAANNLDVSFYNPHFENACAGQAGYTYLDVLSSTQTVVNVFGGTAVQNRTSTAETPGLGAFYFNCGATCNSYGVNFWRNGSATTTVLGWGNTNSATNAKITVCNSNLATTPFTVAVVRGGGVVLLQNNGCLYGFGGNFLQGYNINPGNNQMTWYGGASGPDLTISGNLGGAGTGVANCFAGNAATCTGTSTVDIQGSFGGRTVIFSATTTASGLLEGAQGALTYVFNGGASTTFTLPLLSSSTGRIINVVNRGTAPFTMVASSTDFVAVGDASATTYTVTRGQSLTLQDDTVRWSMLSHDPQRYITASIGGASLAAGACTSTTTGVDSWITTSTSNSRTYPTSPTTYPGDGGVAYSYLSAQGVVTTKICEIVLGTPTASTYTFTVN